MRKTSACSRVWLAACRSRFTKYGSDLKAKLDYEVRGGQGERDARQVFATAGFGAAICLVALWLQGGTFPLVAHLDGSHSLASKLFVMYAWYVADGCGTSHDFSRVACMGPHARAL
ncbi:DUF92 domain-containing protein [archaeon]|nr:MAG: DUF92 domain-containing protein [archaeon]